MTKIFHSSQTDPLILHRGTSVRGRVRFPGTQVDPPSFDFGATFNSEFPRKSGNYNSFVYYTGTEPSASWRFSFRGSMTFTQEGNSVGDVTTFAVTSVAGFSSIVDVYRRLNSVDTYVASVSSPFQYTITSQDVGASLVAKQRLISNDLDGFDANTVVFVDEVIDTTPAATFTGTLSSFQSGTARWVLSGSWDSPVATEQYIYRDRAFGNDTFVAPTVRLSESVTPGDWVATNPNAGMVVLIGGSGTNKSFTTNRTFVVGSSTTGYVGFGSTDIDGATEAEIGASGTWNWRVGDSVSLQFFGYTS